MGEIWVAQNRTTRADVAIKLLRPDVDRAGETHERFRHEARVGATLGHRSIVRVYDLLEEPDGTLILVMELLRGESVLNLVNRVGPRPEDEAVAIISPILSALQHAHEAEIIHRDVSAANIFLAVDPDGQVTPKLVDFGIAKLRSAPSMTVEGHVLGTPRYMSPEQIREGGELSPRSDLFSVGVVLYEILTGTSPFEAGSPAASLAAVLERPIDPDPRISPALFLEIRRALSKQAYERHETARDMAIALRQAIGCSEERLAEALRRLPPPLTDSARATLTSAVTEGGAATPTATDNGAGTADEKLWRGPRWRGPLVTAALLAVVIVGIATGAELLRRRPPGASSGPAESTLRPISSPVPAVMPATPSQVIPPPSVPTVTPSGASSESAATAPPSPQHAPTQVRHEPPKASPAAPPPPTVAKPGKGVATTPGF